MSKYDKKLQEVRARRIMFMSDLNTLECNHPKIYKKLSPLFNDICLWMSYAQEYMDELKQSIEKLEERKVNNQNGVNTKTPLNQHYYDNFILAEKHNNQNRDHMNRPINILDTGKKDV